MTCFTDYVFNDETETFTIYERLVKPMVASSLEGYNGKVTWLLFLCVWSTTLSVVTIFAYGQTSSGKTYTIRGEEGKEGLISLAINDICKAINEVNLYDVCML